MAGLKSQKVLAAKIMKCGASRVWIDPSRIADAGEAITSADVRKLINDGIIKEIPERGVSSFRSKFLKKQKKSGRRKGRGSRKGKKGTRLPKKKAWMSRIRAIRLLIRGMKAEGRIDNAAYRNIYVKARSGFFRSKGHVTIYLERNKMLKEKEEAK